MCYMLARLLAFMQITTVGGGLWYAFVIWIGFIATSFLTNYQFSRRPMALYLIDSLYYLVGMLIAGMSSPSGSSILPQKQAGSTSR